MTSSLETVPNETPEPNPKLGAGYWVAWGGAMTATVAAFCGSIYAYVLFDSPGGTMIGGVIVIVFTAVLIWIGNLPQQARRKRGIEGRMREPYRRYMRRFLPAMFAYVILLMAAVSFAKDGQATGVLAWLVAIAPAIPIIFAIRAIFLLPVEEDDEYQRARIYQAYAWATGATLMVSTTLGFLDMFRVTPHFEMWIAFPMWAIFMGLARCLPLGRIK